MGISLGTAVVVWCISTYQSLWLLGWNLDWVYWGAFSIHLLLDTPDLNDGQDGFLFMELAGKLSCTVQIYTIRARSMLLKPSWMPDSCQWVVEK